MMEKQIKFHLCDLCTAAHPHNIAFSYKVTLNNCFTTCIFVQCTIKQNAFVLHTNTSMFAVYSDTRGKYRALGKRRRAHTNAKRTSNRASDNTQQQHMLQMSLIWLKSVLCVKYLDLLFCTCKKC